MAIQLTTCCLLWSVINPMGKMAIVIIVLSAVVTIIFSADALALIFADSFETPPPCAQTISDDVIADTTWQNGPAACDYLILPRNAGDPIAPGVAPVTVMDAVLTIEPGTVIQFAEDASININEGGSLQAVGTPDARIEFSSRQPVVGFGRGVFFSFDTLPSHIEYADFINLGKETSLTAHDAAIAAAPSSSPSLTLRHTTVSGSATIGAELDEFVLLGFAENRFFDNTEFGLRVSGPQVGLLDQASDYSGGDRPNGRPFVLIEGVSTRDRVTTDALWLPLNAPYFIDIAINIESGLLTLAPGVDMVADQGAAFRISGPGALSAIGTQNLPITFRGEQPVAGYWSGINFFESDAAENQFDFVSVRHAGEGSSEAAVDLDFDAALSLSNSTISDNTVPGICIGFRSTLNDAGGNTFSNNVGGDIITNC